MGNTQHNGKAAIKIGWAALGLASLLAVAAACATRKENPRSQAAVDTIVSKNLPGENYTQQALYFHELTQPKADFGLASEAPAYCAYLMSSNQVERLPVSQFGQRALEEHADQGVVGSGSYTVKPLHIGGMREHYGFTRGMFLDAVKPASTKARIASWGGNSMLLWELAAPLRHPSSSQAEMTKVNSVET